MSTPDPDLERRVAETVEAYEVLDAVGGRPRRRRRAGGYMAALRRRVRRALLRTECQEDTR